MFLRVLIDRFPWRDDPPLPSIGAGLDADRETRFVRDRALQRLADMGQVDGLEHLADKFPDDCPVIATLLREAHETAGSFLARRLSGH